MTRLDRLQECRHHLGGAKRDPCGWSGQPFDLWTREVGLRVSDASQFHHKVDAPGDGPDFLASGSPAKVATGRHRADLQHRVRRRLAFERFGTSAKSLIVRPLRSARFSSTVRYPQVMALPSAVTTPEGQGASAKVGWKGGVTAACDQAPVAKAIRTSRAMSPLGVPRGGSSPRLLKLD